MEMKRFTIYEFEAWMCTSDLGDNIQVRMLGDPCQFYPQEEKPSPEDKYTKWKRVKIRIEEPLTY